MHHVIISMASNRFQKKNLSKARRCLEEILSDIHFTAEYWTEPVNTNRKDTYLNQLAEGDTPLDEAELTERLKSTELQFGRTQAKRSLGIVTIDLDILLYDQEKRHIRDWDRPYVQLLIDELRPRP